MGFEAVGEVARRVRREVDRQRKLDMIAHLSADELRGWIWAREIDHRDIFDGETAALVARARALGVES